ncbi:MAG: Gfo/Idh/MocA family oxidoreductase [Acidobacteria bacterium]|nr:Gfo/Idh/MocA family oxidoreductase [Acidobacteriota bacterium]
MTRRTFLHSTGVASAAAAAAQTPANAQSANGKIQLGCIGTGARGQELMQAILANPGVEIAAVCDAYTGRVERAIERTKGRAKAIADYRQLLASKSIDGVVIATPDHWHKTMILEALDAGKDVYCEKPMTYTAREGADIMAAARRTGRILQIGAQGVSSALQQKAKEIIGTGALGQITMVRAAYNRNTASGAWIYPIPPDASEKTVDWNAFQGPAKNRHPFSLERFFRWRCYNDYSGGIATDLFVHLCTTIHFLMDAKMPSQAMAMGQLYRWKESREVPDTLNAMLQYPEQFAVNLSSTFNNQSGFQGSFDFLGTKGSLSLGGDKLTFSPERAHEDNQWVVDSWASALEARYYADPKVQAAEVPSTWKPHTVSSATVWQAEGQDSTVAHMGHFLDSMRTRKPYWEDASAGHHAAACAHMVNLSVREHRMVEWDFAKDDIKA